jgi:TPR repeat protein
VRGELLGVVLSLLAMNPGAPLPASPPAGGVGNPGKDEPRAAQYERACSNGEPLGCNNLGSLYESGDGVDKDEARAAGLYEKACAAGEVLGCYNLGSLYQEGRGVRKDERHAADLYEKACDAGNPAACYKLGTLYREGVGVGLDESHAATLYEKACAGGEPKGCIGLGLLYEDGLGVEQDGSRAAALYEKACEGGAAMGCANLGVLYQLGLGVGRNEGRAIALFKRACASGVASACASLAKLAPEPPAPRPAPPALSPGAGRALLAGQLSLRGEADVLRPGLVASLSAELLMGAFSGALVLLLRIPSAFRLEGRIYPVQWGPLRPYAGLGASLFFPAAAGRAVVGVDLQLARLHLFGDVAFEHFFNAAPEYAADALLLSLGAGWRF